MPIYRVPVELTWPNNGGPGVNVFHVRTASPAVGGVQGELQLACNALRNFYATIGASTGGVYVNGSTANLGQVVDVEDQTTIAPTWANLAIGGGNSAAPQNLQFAISWRTSIAARRGMGRTFIGPLNSTLIQTDGTPNATSLTTVRNAAAALVSESTNPNGWALCVYGLRDAGPGKGGEYEGLPRVARDVTSSRVRDVFAVLRSRRD
jgi:hypothetical protein